MTPNKKLEKIINDRKLTYCLVPKKNAAITTNSGLNLVKTQKVIVTDCDTIFEENCITLLDKALDKYDVVKPSLIFQTNKNILSKLAANLRTYFNELEGKMYTPGVSFKKSIKNRIGGYFFDEKVSWIEDSEFSNRIKKNRLKTSLVKEAKLIHPPVSMKHDLADALLMGAKKYKNLSLKDLLIKRVKKYDEVLRSFGLTTFIYCLVWYALFDLGRITKRNQFIGAKLQNLSWKIITEHKNGE